MSDDPPPDSNDASHSSESSIYDQEPPPLDVRWMRPKASSVLLQLPTSPVTLVTSPKDLVWQPFTAEESAGCESAWLELNEDERKKAEEDEDPEVGKQHEEDEDEDDETVGVSISKDKLFEVDVRTMRLRPIYWKMNAAPIKVIRATWFYDDQHPVPRNLSQQLEELYMHVKPWLHSYVLELSTALSLGAEAHAKLKQSLDENRSIVFEDANKAYIVVNGSSKRFFSFFPSTSNLNPSTLTFYPGAVPIFRGFEAASVKQVEPTRPRSASVPVKRKVDSDDTGYHSDGADVDVSMDRDQKISSEEKRLSRGPMRETTPPVGNDDDGDVTDLVLIIHGIGQGLATQYEGYNFVYVANLFRQICKKQSTTPALASVMRDRRVQFLPVQWRTVLKLDVDEEIRRKDAGLDNEFSLDGKNITIKKSVPYVRELMNNVLIDIPYFMSRHKDKMIRAVAGQANRIYRLWCARNPGFDKHGRVHIIAHSLGSALSGHILSNQPTIRPPLSVMDPIHVKECDELFLFNTSSLFMLGSPFPLFVHINRTQTIARRGRERTMNSPPDEAYEKAGLFGCLAVDSIYNIFNPSDPVAYLLNPTVDARAARDMPPTMIKNVATPMFSAFSNRVARMFEGVVSTSPRSSSPSRLPMPREPHSSFELGGAVNAVEGTKAERRFLALNPRGTLDYSLPSEGNLSGYVDMITAHSSYWADANLATFILAEIFASKEDLERTGLGVESPVPTAH